MYNAFDMIELGPDAPEWLTVPIPETSRGADLITSTGAVFWNMVEPFEVADDSRLFGSRGIELIGEPWSYIQAGDDELLCSCCPGGDSSHGGRE